MATIEGYRPQLDGLRGLAVAGVLYAHLVDDGSMLGHAGVRLFFVLSGYLITLILLDARAQRDAGTGTGQPMRNFYVRRALRLWPAYYLLLGTALLFDWQQMRDYAWWHIFYASNFLFASTNSWQPWISAPWWTLAVEEQFYLVWPIAILAAPRRFAVPIALSAVGVAIVTRLLLAPGSIAWTAIPLTSLDALAGGGLLAMADRAGRAPRWLPWLVPVALVAIGGALMLPEWPAVQLAEALTVPLFVALVALARRDYRGLPRWLLGTPPLRYLGKISYGIYLYHLVAMAVLFRYASPYAPLLQARGWPLFAAGGGLAVIAGTLSWYLLEAPFNRLKRRFPYP
jgi:peptidoglycan/LPS O-acetylase OafA/YrhL